MKILLLHDETMRPTPVLQDAVAIKIPFHETKAVAGCNCDRWGHPCPGCDEHKFRPNELPISSPAKQNEANTWNT